MVKDRLILEGKCDRVRYPLPRPITGPVVRVAYRDLNIPLLKNGKPIEFPVMEVPVTVSYLRAEKLDAPPDTENTAFWYTRAVYEHFKRPVWFLFEQTLLLFPPPTNDGDWIVVEWEEDPHEESIESMATQESS